MTTKVTKIEPGLCARPPENDETHVYFGRFDELARDATALPGLLSTGEVERMGRFRFAHLRERFVVCHGWLRRILGQILGLDPHALDFTQNPYGKPAVDGIHFNLSHTSTAFIIGVTRVGELGVDIECLRTVERANQIAERYFCPREARLVTHAPDSARDEVFLRLWTLKEAWIKALGTGLSTPLNETDTGYEPSAPHVPLRVGDYRLTPLPGVAPGYVAAVARCR